MAEEYTKKHPELYEYNEKFLDPTLLTGDISKIVHEEVEQIYKFKLFTPEYCKKLIEEAEAFGKWHTEYESFSSVNIVGAEEDDDPETTLHLHQMPPLEDVFYQVVDKHIKPLTETLWKTYKMKKKDRPYILKYEPDVIKVGVEVSIELTVNSQWACIGTMKPSRWLLLSAILLITRVEVPISLVGTILLVDQNLERQ